MARKYWYYCINCERLNYLRKGVNCKYCDSGCAFLVKLPRKVECYLRDCGELIDGLKIPMSVMKRIMMICKSGAIDEVKAIN